MSKYQYGGYCPKCVRPVNASMDGVFCGLEERCCPHCGYIHDKTSVHGGRTVSIWPRAAIRRVGPFWNRRWEVKLDTPRSATAEELGIVPGIRPPPGAVQVPHRIESVESELRDMLTKDGV